MKLVQTTKQIPSSSYAASFDPYALTLEELSVFWALYYSDFAMNGFEVYRRVIAFTIAMNAPPTPTGVLSLEDRRALTLSLFKGLPKNVNLLNNLVKAYREAGVDFMSHRRITRILEDSSIIGWVNVRLPSFEVERATNRKRMGRSSAIYSLPPEVKKALSDHQLRGGIPSTREA